VFTHYVTFAKGCIMQTIGTPIQCPELNPQPEHSQGLPLSDNMQQSLSLLCGFWRNQRILCKISPTGVLNIGDSPLKTITHVVATSDNFDYQGDNVPCNQVIVKAHFDNSGYVWVQTNGDAESTTSWPLASDDVISFGVTNLSQLHLLIENDTEIAIVAYS
jgi:hypothetical protein